MTVPAQATLFNESVANGVTTSFPYQFMIASAADITVELDGEVATTGFTVTGVGNANGGSIDFSVAPANGVTVLRYLDSKLSRTEEDYQQFGDFNADTVDLEFDRLWLAMQSIALKLGLCVRAPISSASGGILPDPAANYVIGWNEDGTGFKNFAPVDNTLLAVELASTDPGHGAELVEYQGATVEAALNERHPEIGTYALLRAYAGPVTAFYVRGVANIFDGGFGVFRVDVSDTTSSDNGGTVLIDASGRRWKRIYDGAVNVLWFGADKIGATSSVPAVNATIAFANSLSTPVKIEFPHGIYDLTAGVTQAVERGYISFNGNNSKINCQSGNVFNVIKAATSLYRNNIENFYFEYPAVTGSPAVPADVNAVPISYSQGFYFSIKNVFVRNPPAAINLANCANYEINGLFGNTINVAKPAISLAACVVGYIDNVSLYNLVDLQPQNPSDPYPAPPVSGNVFIQVTGTTDTLRFGDSVLCNRYHRGLRTITNAGEALLNIWSNNLVVDYCYDRGIYILNNGGSISNLNFEKPYAQAMQGIGIDVLHNAATGLTQGVHINNPKVFLSGSHSISIRSSTSAICLFNATVKNPTIIGGNRLGVGGYDIYAKWARVSVYEGQVGLPSSLAGATYACQATYGILFDTCDQYNVRGVGAGGSGSSFAFTNDVGTTYRARRVTDNHVMPGYSALDRPEYVTSTTLVAVVSGDTYTNTTPYRQQVSIYGVSSSVAATIEVNGVQASTRSEFSCILEPGDTLKVTTAGSCNRRIFNLA